MDLLKFLDNTTLPKREEDGYDKHSKVRPFIDTVNAKMIDSYMTQRKLN